MSLIQYLRDAVRLAAFPQREESIVVYSEGAHHWSHLGDIVRELLETSDRQVCYVTSGPDDPALELTHARFHPFRTNRGRIRDWLLNNLVCRLCVMTMPDLGQFQVVRSPGVACYAYVPHSMVSLHMAYRPGAFDHYDVLYCAGPHHVAEARAIEQMRSAPKKMLVEQGYARIDAMREAIAPGQRENPRPRVLLAPSWGASGLLESGCHDLIAALLEADMMVTVRPHPETARHRPDALRALHERFSSDGRFAFDRDESGWRSYQSADTMISDWSGAAFEFAFSRQRPLVFIDTPPKVNNAEFTALDEVPLEIGIRDQIGVVASPGDPLGTVNAVREALSRPDMSDGDLARYLFNPGHAAKTCAAHLAKLAEAGTA
tara:strand:- start:579 stop:1703 length:1125 start_codon:yes stop_codon:yes gene_type:complete